MTVITFTEEKKKLISDWLKAHCGGRKWHEVKAKKQEQAEEYADDIIAKNAAEKAIRDAAEALRQERLALPAQRLYDGIDLTHAPTIHLEGSIPAYKSIFRSSDDWEESGNILYLSFTYYLSALAIANVKDVHRKLGLNNHNEEFFSKVKGYFEDDILRMLNSTRGKESVDNDNRIMLRLYKLYNQFEYALYNSDVYKYDADKAYHINLFKKGLIFDNKFRKVIMWIVKNPPVPLPFDMNSGKVIPGMIEKFLDEVGHKYVTTRNVGKANIDEALERADKGIIPNDTAYIKGMRKIKEARNSA